MQGLSLRRTVIFTGLLLILIVSARRKSITRFYLLAFTIFCFLIIGIQMNLNVISQGYFQFVRVFETFKGTQFDSSTLGHLMDIKVGLSSLHEIGIFGLGPNAVTLSGLVVQRSGSNLFYIHNEFLNQWYVYGIPGFIAIIFLIFPAALKSLYSIRQDCGFFVNFSKLYFMSIPIILFFSSGFTFSPRVQALTGICFGILQKDKYLRKNFLKLD